MGNISVYIRDKNKKWVDFTSRFSRNSKGLKNISSISKVLSGDSVNNLYKTDTTTIVLDNSDYFWDSYNNWDDVTTVDGNKADFDSTKKGYEADIAGHWIRIMDYKDDKDITLGLFKIKKFSTFINKGIAKLKLNSLAAYLDKKSAEFARDGRGWYVNKPVAFLIDKLLSVLDDDLFNIDLPDRIKIPTSSNNRVFSQLGQPVQNVKDNLYNPLFYYPFTSEFSNSFMNENLQGDFE